jgi:hypothetical protein
MTLWILISLKIFKIPKNFRKPEPSKKSASGTVESTSMTNLMSLRYFLAIRNGSKISSPFTGSIYVVLKLIIISRTNTRSIQESRVLICGEFNSSGLNAIEIGIVIA